MKVNKDTIATHGHKIRWECPECRQHTLRIWEHQRNILLRCNNCLICDRLSQRIGFGDQDYYGQLVDRFVEAWKEQAKHCLVIWVQSAWGTAERIVRDYRGNMFVEWIRGHVILARLVGSKESTLEVLDDLKKHRVRFEVLSESTMPRSSARYCNGEIAFTDNK